MRDANRGTADRVLQRLAAGEHRVRARFDNLAGFSCDVTRTALEELANDPNVESIEPVIVVEAHLAQGIPLMNALATRSTYSGTNMAIAICDTGIDYTHARLGGGGFPNSKVIGGYDFGNWDADPTPASTQAHGTCCAGIAAGDLGTTGDYIGGVAPGAKLYSLKISFGSTGSASNDSMIAAWDWCVTHKNDDPTNPIMVISTSFGGGRYYSRSAGDAYSPAMTAAASNAVAAGITVVASSGNNGWCDSMGWPAVISHVISVGAAYDANFGTYLPCVDSGSCANKIATTGCLTGYYVNDSTAADKVTAYSNSASFLDVFAPANQCYTTDIVGSGGYDTSGDYYASFGGTSAACPYTAGAVACLQNAAKAQTGSYLTPAEVRALFAATGDLITDSKVAITKPRVNLGNAIGGLSMTVTPSSGLSSTGFVGGAFSPLCATYTITNRGTATFGWIATQTQPWLTITPASGSLPAGSATNFDVCINATANSLPAGAYNDVVTVSNLTSGVTASRPAQLIVSLPRVYYFPLDTDPGWTTTGQWAFGQPTGGGGTSFGSPDPASGATGTNVFGVNLSGDYTTAVGGPFYLTTGPLDFTGKTSAKLRFQRWLNSDYQPYVFATLQVSSNGTAWTQIWSNGTTEITATSWSTIEHDISAIADNRATVYVRWGYQVAASAFAYSGWNLDDIEFLANSVNTPPVITNAFVTPATPDTTQTLTANAFATDAETNTVTFAYQWQESSTNLVGQTAGTLSGAATKAGGSYRVVITPDDGFSTGTNYITVAVPVALDSDADGLNDDWEVLFFSDLSQPADADFDGDGFTNLQEQAAGTDPTSTASALRITHIAAAGNDLLVTWTTTPGTSNVLERTAGDVNGGFSTNAFTILFTVNGATDATTNFTDVGAVSLPQQYYRVRIIP